MNLNKDEDDYIIDIKNPDENIFVFRGVRKIIDVHFENFFGQKLWDDSVIKLVHEEKTNILVIFTNFDNFDNNQKQNDNKIKFRLLCNSKVTKDKFTPFTLSEFRNKYM